MIVQMVIGNGDKLALSSLPYAMQEQLAEELGTIRLVDKMTVSSVAEEFVRELEGVGIATPGGPETVLKTLGDHISPDLASKLRTSLNSQLLKDPWSLITALEVEDLVPIMNAQSIEIAAVVLSKLTVRKAAELLGELPGERARRITYAVSQTADISPDAVHRIGTALAQEHCVSEALAFEKAPVKRVGAILNSSATMTRENVLEGLDSQDPVFASDVRKALFTFSDIPTRIATTDIPNCIRGVPVETLNLAIAGALAAGGPLAASAEFIIENVSQRMAGQIRDDVAELGKVKQVLADGAMNELTASIRDLTDAGTITMVEPEGGDE